MKKPTVILDPDWRQMDELFSPSAKARLFATYVVVWGRDAKIEDAVLEAALPKADILIAATPKVDAKVLERAPKLRAIIEVSGSFPDTIDYAGCHERGIEVLTCAPGFRQSVAEMGLAMALAGARGLFNEHEAFRTGDEHWLADNADTDFSLFGADIGFIGFGQIAQEIARLMSPFAPTIRAYDPWLPDAIAQSHSAKLLGLDDVLKASRCVFMTATPTAENYHLLNAANIALMPKGALLILLSRAHLVDFEALVAAVSANKIRAAVDVFPSEPVAKNDPIRTLPNAVLSPHRAAAVSGGRQLIGEMILADLDAIFSDTPGRRLGVADVNRIEALAGIGDANEVEGMARGR